MAATISSFLKIAVTWSDKSRVLAQEMAHSGFVQTLSHVLHAGMCTNTLTKVCLHV